MGPSSPVKGGSGIWVSPRTSGVTEPGQVPRKQEDGKGALRRGELPGPGRRHCWEAPSPTRGASGTHCIFRPPGSISRELLCLDPISAWALRLGLLTTSST